MDALRDTPIISTNVKGHLDTLEVKELTVQAATTSAKLLVFVRFTRVDSHAKSVDFCHSLVCQAFRITGIALAEINSNWISILQLFTAIIAKNKRVRPVIFGVRTVHYLILEKQKWWSVIQEVWMVWPGEGSTIRWKWHPPSAGSPRAVLFPDQFWRCGKTTPTPMKWGNSDQNWTPRRIWTARIHKYCKSVEKRKLRPWSEFPPRQNSDHGPS